VAAAALAAREAETADHPGARRSGSAGSEPMPLVAPRVVPPIIGRVVPPRRSPAAEPGRRTRSRDSQP
jgi:hypothetical protein